MLEKLPEVGERVILTSKVFGCSEGNPQWGTHLGCPGTVYKVECSTVRAVIRVEWENGTVNSYRIEHLDYYRILPANNPNITFLSRNEKPRRKKK